jgi:FtsH-binding integral membrane protein
MSQSPYGYTGANMRGNVQDYAGERTSIAPFFNAVYAWMAVGIALTALVAWFVSQTPALWQLVYAGKGMVIVMALAAFGISWYVQANFQRISVAASTILFLVYATVIGTMISYIFLVYSRSTILSAFFLTAGTFGAMSLYGFVTKRDLTGIGSILIMAAIGLFIASLVNVFLGNNALGWIITYGILIVFVGITAYETQMLKNMAYEFQGNGQMLSRLAIVGSLVLYISFINIFLSILRILGSRDE